MFRANYAFTLLPKAVQVLSKPLRVSVHRTAPQGSNTRLTIARVAHLRKSGKSNWSFKRREPRPVFNVEI